MTTNRRPKGVLFNKLFIFIQNLFHFLKEVKSAIPNTFYYERNNNKIKDIIEWAKKRDFTDVMVFYEKQGLPRNIYYYS